MDDDSPLFESPLVVDHVDVVHRHRDGSGSEYRRVCRISNGQGHYWRASQYSHHFREDGSLAWVMFCPWCGIDLEDAYQHWPATTVE